MSTYYVLGLYEQKQGELLGISLAKKWADKRQAELEKEYPSEKFVVVDDEDYKELEQEYLIF